MKYLFLFVPLLFSFSAHGDSLEDAVSITEKECRKLMRMNDMSGADYVPGVDARGNPVTPADLEPHPMAPPKEITFNLGIDLAERYGLGDDIKAGFTYGEITVKGRNVYFNGHRLGTSESNAALEACRAQYQ